MPATRENNRQIVHSDFGPGPQAHAKVATATLASGPKVNPGFPSGWHGRVMHTSPLWYHNCMHVILYRNYHWYRRENMSLRRRFKRISMIGIRDPPLRRRFERRFINWWGQMRVKVEVKNKNVWQVCASVSRRFCHLWPKPDAAARLLWILLLRVLEVNVKHTYCRIYHFYIKR